MREIYDKAVSKIAETAFEDRFNWFEFGRSLTPEVKVKPTEHKQICIACGKNLARGDVIIKCILGCGGTGGYFSFPIYSYYHSECFLAAWLLTYNHVVEESHKSGNRIRKH